MRLSILAVTALASSAAAFLATEQLAELLPAPVELQHNVAVALETKIKDFKIGLAGVKVEFNKEMNILLDEPKPEPPHQGPPAVPEHPHHHKKPHHHHHKHHSLIQKIKWFLGMRSCKGKGRRPDHPEHHRDEHHREEHHRHGHHEEEKVGIIESLWANPGTAELEHKVHIHSKHPKSIKCQVKNFIKTSPFLFVILAKALMILSFAGIITAFRNRVSRAGAIRLEEEVEVRDEKKNIEIVVV